MTNGPRHGGSMGGGLSIKKKESLRENPYRTLPPKKKQVRYSGRVVKVSDRCWPCQEFESSTTKDSLPCREGQCTLNRSRIKRPPVCVVWKSGECSSLRCRPRHLNMVQNDVVRRQKPSNS
ncbi:hypothetical protein TNCV_848681 [Trichonephila clavipes]|uniref:Uncharacterized protein n=1 Tax=Trichonephila clavipes TaxID=2585209 RepID=A0A8X6V127_TRICX|nr:hypothetical protein TNCV_848681 [Trichonephila clavipes]